MTVISIWMVTGFLILGTTTTFAIEVENPNQQTKTENFQADIIKQQRVEGLLRRAGMGLDCTRLQAIREIDDFFMEEGNKPFQIYGGRTEKLDELSGKIIEIIKLGPYDFDGDCGLKNPGPSMSPQKEAVNLLRFFSFQQRIHSMSTLEEWSRNSPNYYAQHAYERLFFDSFYDLMSSLSDGPFDISSEEGRADILRLSEVWSYDYYLIRTTSRYHDQPFPSELPIYTEVGEKLGVQGVLELLKTAKNSREFYFVMNLIASSYVRSVEIQMIPHGFTPGRLVPKVIHEAIFATNFQDSPDYQPKEGFPDLRWLENKELRRVLENLSRVRPETDKKLFEPNSLPLNAIRILSYGPKVESTTRVIEEFVVFVEENEATIFSQFSSRTYERYKYISSKRQLAISYLMYYGWEALPKVLEWLSSEGELGIEDIHALELIELVSDMAYIAIPREAHSHYFDFFENIFQRCRGWTSLEDFFEKGLKNIEGSEERIAQLREIHRSCQ